ncbi:MAG: hypothetical protein E7L15_17575 [Citrobacter portucalensis]|nr:hypothetical protein [Citrobacter portucalensis]
MEVKLEKEKDKLSLTGQGELIITNLKNDGDAGITMLCDGAFASVQYMYVANARGRTRIGRFFSVIKHVWRVCK